MLELGGGSDIVTLYDNTVNSLTIKFAETITGGNLSDTVRIEGDMTGAQSTSVADWTA